MQSSCPGVDPDSLAAASILAKSSFELLNFPAHAQVGGIEDSLNRLALSIRKIRRRHGDKIGHNKIT
jgi:hypothetical protein